MKSLNIKKHKDCFRSKPLRDFILTRPCLICVKLSRQQKLRTTVSHLYSVKWSESSDSQALQACFEHHPQSTAAARAVFTNAGIDLEKALKILWREFLLAKGLPIPEELTQHVFELLLVEHGLGEYGDKSERKNRKEHIPYNNPFR